MAYVRVLLVLALDPRPWQPIGESSGDTGILLPPLAALEYPLLRLVDPYGDTYFSSYQMAGVIPELERLALEKTSGVLLEVLELARLCSTRRSYLVFVGD
jgi:hypothetical protein